MTFHSHLSPSKLATRNRQACINILDKITKNLFRMFRNEDTTKEQITDKFFELKKELDKLWDVVLTGDHHREMRIYVELLAQTFERDFDLEAIRWPNMTKLNRLQKIKNKTEYKRKKRVKLRLQDIE